MKQRLFLSIVILFLFTTAAVAENNEAQLTEEDIIAMASAQDFDMDAYTAQLESIAGKDYQRFQALQERFGVSEQQREEAEAAKQRRLWLITILSLIVALIPAFVIVRQVITGEIKPAGPIAVIKTIGILLGWGIVLFAFHFGWLWVLLTNNTRIMGIVMGLLLLAVVIYASISVNNYYKKNR